MTTPSSDCNPEPVSVPVTVCIPTYRREGVLVETIRQFLVGCRPEPREIVVVDQTPVHTEDVASQLAAWESQGRIRWIRRHTPSQPAALNEGLLRASQPLVLFVDDDIRIEPDILTWHTAAFADGAVWASVGQILQPGQVESSLSPASEAGPFADLDFPFHSSRSRPVTNVMSGNLMVSRDRACSVGGFDENFMPPVSYRFDSDFAKRVVLAGGRIQFVPRARIYHLRASVGGTRSRSSHLTSASPEHGVGDYYFAFKHARGWRRWRYILKRPLREVITRFHLGHPWYVPVKLLGEVRALLSAIKLSRCPPALLARHDG